MYLFSPLEWNHRVRSCRSQGHDMTMKLQSKGMTRQWNCRERAQNDNEITKQGHGNAMQRSRGNNNEIHQSQGHANIHNYAPSFGALHLFHMHLSIIIKKWKMIYIIFNFYFLMLVGVSQVRCQYWYCNVKIVATL